MVAGWLAQKFEIPFTKTDRRNLMLSELCEEIHSLFLAGVKGTNRELFDKAYELSNYFVQNLATPELLEPIIGLERRLISGKGPLKQFLEEQVFQALFTSVLHCAPEASGKKRVTLNPALIERRASARQKQRHMMALKLVGFSMEVFQMQNPRDAFNNKRKGLAMDLIGRVGSYYDVPEAIELCTAALQSNKKTLVLAAVELYENYRRGRNLSLTPEMVHRLDDVISKTKDRSVAVTALNLQVETGLISELEALSRIDEWKERNLERI
jgi:hypothetical protein